MASNEQQWAITSRAKQQIRQNKRKERAQRMHMQVMMNVTPFLFTILGFIIFLCNVDHQIACQVGQTQNIVLTKKLFLLIGPAEGMC